MAAIIFIVLLLSADIANPEVRKENCRLTETFILD